MIEKVKVAKLYSRHFKVRQQVEYLERIPVQIAVGTPHRILTLIERGVLSLERCKHVMVDMSLNVKKMNLFDMKDTSMPFFRFCQTYLFEKVKEGGTKITLF